jgi:phosphoglycerate dehydrogenase-like enzyme
MIRERFPELEIVSGNDNEILRKHIHNTDVLIAWKFPMEILKEAKRLRWIQLTTAGSDHLMEFREFLRGVVVTNTRGIHVHIMADFALLSVLLLQWQLPSLLADQQEMRWIIRSTEPLAGKTLGILGVGAIGSEIARRARCFHMHVLGVKRSPAPVDGVDRVYGPDRLEEVLSAGDFVVIALPLTPDTRQRIGEPELRIMKRTAYLINISRGAVVVESSLIKALREKWISGAVLDVFEEEPLPETSPLWTLRNVIVTPHISGEIKDYPKRVLEVFSENLLRWKSGKQLINMVDFGRGY